MKTAATGKRFGRTAIEVCNSAGELQRLLGRCKLVEASQVTTHAAGWIVRWQMEGKSYLLAVPSLPQDPQEERRLWRVVVWYMDTLLAAVDSGLFTPMRLFGGLREVAPGITVTDLLADPA